jgi:hypothetical protein
MEVQFFFGGGINFKNVHMSKTINIFTASPRSLECSSIPPLIRPVLIFKKLLLRGTCVIFCGESTACPNHPVPEGVLYMSYRDWGDRREEGMSYIIDFHIGEWFRKYC